MNEYFMLALIYATPAMLILGAVYFLVMEWVENKASSDAKE